MCSAHLWLGYECVQSAPKALWGRQGVQECQSLEKFGEILAEEEGSLGVAAAG